jgi:hypothetical protein
MSITITKEAYDQRLVTTYHAVRSLLHFALQCLPADYDNYAVDEWFIFAPRGVEVKLAIGFKCSHLGVRKIATYEVKFAEWSVYDFNSLHLETPEKFVIADGNDLYLLEDHTVKRGWQFTMSLSMAKQFDKHVVEDKLFMLNSDGYKVRKIPVTW